MTHRRDISCCLFCGRDTPNKSQICRFCTGGHSHNQEYASASADCHTRIIGEEDYDYSENACGPRTADERMGLVYVYDGGEERESKKHGDL
jgi:hypothetical protein